MKNKSYQNIIVVTALCLMALGIIVSWDNKAYDPYPKFYNHSGLMAGKQMRVYVDTVPATSATVSIDLTPAGFTTIASYNASVIKNTTDPTVTPFSAVKTITNTAITVNVFTENSSLISILGSSVLLGAPMTLSAPANTQIAVIVVGF